MKRVAKIGANILLVFLCVINIVMSACGGELSGVCGWIVALLYVIRATYEESKQN